jgi:prephenate dehydrogenase
MAGSERSGPQAGDAGLFTGATWVLTPTDATEDDALARASALARGLGARVLVLRPDEHDHIVGLVSHLPQLVASVLADVAAEAVGTDREAVMAVAGPGFRDTTRIAASDPALWLDIVEGNRDAILAALRSYVGRLGDVVEAIERDDLPALDAVLRRASSARQRLLPKGISEPTTDLRVPLRDRPGEIARITGALGSAGINIEDLAMRHASAADRGSLLIRVRATAAPRATEVLEAADVDGVVIETVLDDGIGR